MKTNSKKKKREANDIEADVESLLCDLKKKKLYRFLNKPQGTDFCSNDYLSLSSHSEMREFVIQALKDGCPLGSSSSRLLRGHTLYHENIEAQLKTFMGQEAVLLFSSGYLANVGALSSLCKGAQVFSDEFNHASLIDGMKLSGGKVHIYPHKDVYHLEQSLKKEAKKRRKVIVTESLFSMEGDFAPLETLIDLSEKYSALLFVDEAHATGIFGGKGEGCLHEILKKRKGERGKSSFVLSLHTFGKALGSQGAFLACSKTFRDHFINTCRPFIFTTAPSPLLTKVWEISLSLIQRRDHERELLKKKAAFFKESLLKMGFSTTSESQIIPLILGSNKKALDWSHALQRKGLDVRAIRYPSVPKGTARLRVCIHAQHKKKDLILLLNSLAELKGTEEMKEVEKR